jgi:phosphatidylethanolamine/phosphatidyl-N-methylethanolamine N-methyltransferase
MSEVNSQTKETELFFRQWLRSPKSMGAVIPSSRALARAVSREIA